MESNFTTYDTWTDADGNQYLTFNGDVTITKGDPMSDPRVPFLRATLGEARPAFDEPFISEQAPGRFANLDWGQP